MSPLDDEHFTAIGGGVSRSARGANPRRESGTIRQVDHSRVTPHEIERSRYGFVAQADGRRVYDDGGVAERVAERRSHVCPALEARGEALSARLIAIRDKH